MSFLEGMCVLNILFHKDYVSNEIKGNVPLINLFSFGRQNHFSPTRKQSSTTSGVRLIFELICNKKDFEHKHISRLFKEPL